MAAREKVVSLRLSDAEYADLKSRAKRAGSNSAAVRELLGYDKQDTARDEHQQTLATLGRIHAALERLGRWCVTRPPSQSAPILVMLAAIERALVTLAEKAR